MKRPISSTTGVLVVLIALVVMVALFFVFLKGKSPRRGGGQMPQKITPFGAMKGKNQPPEGARTGKLPPQARPGEAP